MSLESIGRGRERRERCLGEAREKRGKREKVSETLPFMRQFLHEKEG
jgi:hypothetical protein